MCTSLRRGFKYEKNAGELVSSTILATAAAVLQRPGSLTDATNKPAIVHACTSTTVEPLTVSAMLESGREFWSAVQPTFRLPLTVLPRVAPNHAPNR